MKRTLSAALLASLVAVTSPTAAQRPWTVDSTPSITIGGDSPAGEPVLNLPSGATRLPDGTFVVADGTAPAIRFFTRDGRLVRSVGRTGSGPGEYTMISWLGRCGGDSLFAYDLFQRRFTVLDSKGQFVRQFRAPSEAASIACSPGGVFALLGGGVMAGVKPGSGARVKARVVLARSGGASIDTIPDVPFYKLADAGGMPVPDPFGPVTVLALSGDRVFLGTGDSSSVDVYTLEGRRVASAVVPAARRRPTAAHQAAAIDDFLRFTTDAPMRRVMQERLAKLPAPDRLPPYSSLLTDGEGLLWVHRSVQGDARSELTAVGADGRVVATVTLPVYLRVLEIGADYILGSRIRDDGEPEVLVYRLVRGT